MTRAGMAPLHTRRATYSCHWRDFRRNFSSLEGALNYIFPVKTFAIGGRRKIAKGAFGAQGGHCPVAPAYAPADVSNLHFECETVCEHATLTLSTLPLELGS